MSNTEEKKTLPKGIINPFSGDFLTQWDLYKKYRWEEHKFKYKGCLSEQAALMKLNYLSGGNEEIAKGIILQSIENGWKGLFEYKNSLNGKQTITESRNNLSDVLGARDYERRGS
jgi:hypothetical protein